ncbi:copper amine oxidase N-terminal domain-containing protein [Paenibacillus lutimineralis]|uniref:copper amine oxidase N-terminal domain-containing protein n=1 Tax=Paenibacillus TaxID=44249 RepID=UPI002559B29C|nr:MULTISPECIES: copper amine oxidase N-terminal domain-containing protein [Paenibacillus]
MKKIWTMLLAAILVVPLLLQPATAQAAKAITIYVDGVQLKTDVPPVMVQGRVMLPLRAIFEALDARVYWNQKSQTVTGIKGDTTVVLKIKSKVATINDQTVTLDVPAQTLRGRTMVPVRFVSEALGQDVGWNSRDQIVTIKSDTPINTGISPVSYVSARDIGNQGDGRDLEVSFSKSSTESLVDHYRILVVKASKSFNLASALNVSASNYTTVSTANSDRAVTLSQSSRDVDGDYIRNDQPYVVYVLAVGKGSYSSALSSSSPKITLTDVSSVVAVTNVKISDISDFGDGRDISVSFTRPQNDNNISNYRVFIVKTKDANNFSLTTANNLSSSYYTTVYKSGSNGSTMTGTLSSSARDTSGDYIKNGVPYTAFVLSVSNTNSAVNKLSSASSSVTLSPNTVSTPVITQVDDISDYGDGRDLRIGFNKVSDESNISSYRIFVVRANNYSNFTLTKANNLSSSYYTQVNKTGYNITQVLSSGARDTDGNYIQNGVSYRVFVMAVARNSGNNVLSSASNAITLYSNNVGTVSNLYASDVNDYGDGRDLYVSFNKVADESNISHYRIMVVPTSYYSSFSLSDANNVSSSYYTQVNKTGNYTYGQALTSSTRDVRGNYIKEGVSYRVYVLSVGYGNYSGSNALSSPSSTITLGKNYNVQAVSNLTVADVNDYGNGRDLQVSFTKPSDESNVNHYRILVVPTSYYSSFSLSQANSSSYYVTESKGGNRSVTRTLDGARDVRGNYITEGTSYRVYVLTVANGNSSNANALTSAPSVITLSKNKAVQAVSNVSASDVGDKGNGSDLQVTFNHASDGSNISEYRIMVVPRDKAYSFDATAASNIRSPYYTSVSTSGSSTRTTLAGNATDVYGGAITNNSPYYIYVLSVGKGSSNGIYTLSAASNEITLTNTAAVEAATNVRLSTEGNTGTYSDIRVSFNKPRDERNVAEYRVFMVPSIKVSEFNVAFAGRVSSENYKSILSGQNTNGVSLELQRDAYGGTINTDTYYQAVVMTVASTNSGSPNILSDPSVQFRLPSKPDDNTPVEAATIEAAVVDPNGITVKFNKPAIDTNISGYEVYVVADNTVLTLDTLSQAIKSQPEFNSSGQAWLEVSTNKKYNIYVLSRSNTNNKKSALSQPFTTQELQP